MGRHDVLQPITVPLDSCHVSEHDATLALASARIPVGASSSPWSARVAASACEAVASEEALC